MKDVLIFGGTKFLGKATVSAFARQPERFTITVANRGSRPVQEPGVRQILLDRVSGTGCPALADHHFDAVIDFSAYNPEHLYTTLPHTRTGHYLFISSGSAMNRNPRAKLYTYGKNKHHCELLVRRHHPNATIVRPGFVAGEGDYLDRFVADDSGLFYRVKATGAVLRGYIDVHTLAQSLTQLVRYPQTGIASFGFRSKPI